MRRAFGFGEEVMKESLDGGLELSSFSFSFSSFSLARGKKYLAFSFSFSFSSSSKWNLRFLIRGEEGAKVEEVEEGMSTVFSFTCGR